MADSDLESGAARLRPQSFLFGCELKASEKEYKVEVDDDESEHQLSLRTVCLGVGASGDLHLVEAEGLNAEGKRLKITLAALKLSVQPTVSLGGFEMAPPVTFRLKSGAGPVHISGQHLIALGDEDLDSDEEDDSMLEDISLKRAIKRPAAGAPKIMQKKMKVEDSDEDEDDDDEEEDVTPAKKKTPAKANPGSKGNPDQNGKTSNKSTPAKNQAKTPERSNKPKMSEQGKPKTPEHGNKPKTPEHGNKPKTPKPPKTPLTVEEIKAKLKTSVGKGISLPKLEPKFVNYIKNDFRIEDPKIIKELWAWRQTMEGK